MRINEMITKDKNNVVMLEQNSLKQSRKECMKNSVEKMHVDVWA